MTLEEVHEYFKKSEEKMIKKVGGACKWNNLSDIRRLRERQ